MNVHTDWNLIRTFLVVAAHLHRGDAAQQLGISVRTIARHISQLEDELGVMLVTRSRQCTTLTPTGVWLRDALLNPLAQANEALLEARRHQTPMPQIAVNAELPPGAAHPPGA